MTRGLKSSSVNKRDLGDSVGTEWGAGFQTIRAIKTGQEIESGHYDVRLDVTRTWKHKWVSFVAIHGSGELG